MVPLDAEHFKPFKYMCFCPTKIFCGLSAGRKVRSRLKIGAKIKKVMPLAAPSILFTDYIWRISILCISSSNSLYGTIVFLAKLYFKII